MANRQKILILGGGFGGIKTALELSEHPLFNVTLVSDQKTFRYYPQLYRIATGGRRDASQIPLAEIFADKNVDIVYDSVQTLDRQAGIVAGASGQKYNFDILVIALGVVTNFFGIKGLDKYAYGIKTVEESRRLRDHLHKLLIEKQKPDINYVVIGGGPTGVELAGALPDYIRHIMKRHNLADRPIHVDLVEAEKRLLPRMPKSYSRAVTKRLRQLGIKLHLGETVKAETADKLMVTDLSIKSHTVVWTAGVTNHPFLADNNFSLSDHGRAVVDTYLQADVNIYIIGDNADTPYSGMAQTALYDGKFVAENLKRQVENKQPQGYKPKKPIYVMPIGPGWAALLWDRVHIYGFLGWMVRSAADFMAYREFEPWRQATKRWQASLETEETCPVCVAKRPL
ncbi:FAD-dependent oxidoreductase [Candidatus Saccharibacteria bacterium]|nr:FAD-dependent oxidoreductase [Candidatus Saccharibacteria bacterium]